LKNRLIRKKDTKERITMALGYTVAIVGATSTVGVETVRILEERAFPIKELVPLEMGNSLQGGVEYQGVGIPSRILKKSSFSGVDFSFFTSEDSVSREYASEAVKQGGVVIDFSPAFRMDDDVPLIIPEVNSHRIADHKGIIASPGCSTIQMVLPLYPIHKKARIKRIVVSTYQAVSDNGQQAMNELTDQVRDLYNFREITSQVYPHQIAFNAVPHVDRFCDNAYTAEEMSIVCETQKIMEDENIRICATSVQIPVFYSHSQSVNIETARKISPGDIRDLLEEAPGVEVEDDPSRNRYPLAINAAGRDECFVGRIREDFSVNNGIALWIVSDNIRKGAALNAVQIAEKLISHDAQPN
jgi:aspartate-semialdehyde dehydrogenase